MSGARTTRLKTSTPGTVQRRTGTQQLRPSPFGWAKSSHLGWQRGAVQPASIFPASARLSTTVVTDAAGAVEASLIPGSNVLTWKITYAGLSGPATGAHFRGPATIGQYAAVVVPIKAPLAGF